MPHMERQKDPVRVRAGRLGALTVHARGRTNTGPARRAWEAGIAAEVDPDGALGPEELARRTEYAMRVRMTRLAMRRWGGKKKAGPAPDMPDPAEGDGDDTAGPRPAA